jgi:hypothetical protein
VSNQEKRIKAAFCKRRLETSAHDHFAEIREGSNGDPYLVLDQKATLGAKRWAQRLILSKDEIPSIIALLTELEKAMDGAYKKEPAPQPQAPVGASLEDGEFTFLDFADNSEAKR